MEKNKYVAPQIKETGLCLEGFLCVSIVKATFNVEVDEYVNLKEQEFVLDGYDY